MLETESLCFLCRYFLPHMSRCLAYFVCAPSLYFGHITLYLPPWKNFSVMQNKMLKQWDWTRGLYRCFEIGPTVTPVQVWHLKRYVTAARAPGSTGPLADGLTDLFIRYNCCQHNPVCIGITLKRGVIYLCHEAKPRGRNISTRVFV